MAIVLIALAIFVAGGIAGGYVLITIGIRNEDLVAEPALPRRAPDHNSRAARSITGRGPASRSIPTFRTTRKRPARLTGRRPGLPGAAGTNRPVSWILRRTIWGHGTARIAARSRPRAACPGRSAGSRSPRPPGAPPSGTLQLPRYERTAWRFGG